jgi:hypothetical protein
MSLVKKGSKKEGFVVYSFLCCVEEVAISSRTMCNEEKSNKWN